VLAATAAAPAGAATQIGQTFLPNPLGPNCSDGFTRLQGTSPGGQYAAPSAGVLTAWSFEAGPSPPRLRFKAAHPEGGNSFTIVGESDLRTPVPNQVNTYSDVRIPVRPGDVIGFYLADIAPCYRVASGYQENIRNADALPGGTASFDLDLPNSNQLDVSAVLEPDCDSDGFGDETQDPDISSCNPDTVAPDTTITKRPKDKTKKKQATFEFSSSEAGSTFECSLDGVAFSPCSSPDTLKVKKGKHSFAVRAKDAAGNVDGSPASDGWKVKKKKKHK
jgi:hypothetical protein